MLNYNASKDELWSEITRLYSKIAELADKLTESLKRENKMLSDQIALCDGEEILEGLEAREGDEDD